MVIVNTLLDNRYVFCPSDHQLKVFNDIRATMIELESTRGQIVVLNYLPRLGKTHTLLDYLNNSENTLSLYVSDIHKQMEQMTQKFEKMWVIKGAAKICPLLNCNETPQRKRNELEYLFNGNLKRNLACRYCNLRSSCEYTKQFDFPENDVILTIAKESLPNKKVHTAFDFIIFDENMVKAAEIEPTLPPMNTEILDSLKYGSQILLPYEDLKIIIDDAMVLPDSDVLKGLKDDAEYLGSDKVLRTTLKEIKEMDFKKTNGIIPFMANLYQTVEWAEICYNVGEYRPKHFKPYLHEAFNLLNKYDSNLIIANATFDESIYNQIKNQYHKQLPEIKKTLNLPIENKKSHLLHYIHPRGRGNSMTALEEYKNEIFPMVEAIPRFCHKRGLKSGLITFRNYKEFFPDFDVIDHFVAHRGKDDFDDVDVLTILGTFNISRFDYLTLNYQITGEYLPKDYLHNRKWIPETINNCQITVPKNQKFRDTKLYHLYEEHTQAILRSGAHIKANKVIIAFGYVPKGVDEIFTYKIFKNRHELINGFLTNIYTKQRRRKNK